MSVAGGQTSQNRGNPFASEVGLLGVTSDPRDMGFPQVSTGGLYSTFGDPTSFTTRDNHHVELFDNVTFDRGAHRVKVGAYYFHLRLRPEQPDNARGSFTFTGQFTGNAFADFLSAIHLRRVGIGRGERTVGPTGCVYAQDDYERATDDQCRARYEYNQHGRRQQPSHIGRPFGAGWTVRDRATTTARSIPVALSVNSILHRRPLRAGDEGS
jgi:hypothetical protein